MIIDSILLVTFYSQKLKKNEGLWLGVFFLISPIVGIITYNVYAKYIMPFRDTSNFERIVAARSAYEGFLKYPLTGIGFGQWINSHEVMYVDDIQTFLDENSETKLSRNPHNTFLRIALDTGGIGISVFMILLIRFGKMSIQLFKRHRSKRNIYDIACLCLNLVFLNLVLSMLFGDFLESQQAWTIFFAIVVAYKNESIQNLISIENSYSKSLHLRQRS